ncbi:MAG: hypothetical protein NZ822_03300, partial [Patescibacteria group bacterium]|nr:hypothetical protein [Patescibacteria group bacterium]
MRLNPEKLVKKASREDKKGSKKPTVEAQGTLGAEALFDIKDLEEEERSRLYTSIIVFHVLLKLESASTLIDESEKKAITEELNKFVSTNIDAKTLQHISKFFRKLYDESQKLESVTLNFP